MYRSLTRISFIILATMLLLSVHIQSGAVQLVDQDGVALHIDRPFDRIISLYPAHTENLIELGAAARLIGISASDAETQATSALNRFSYHDSIEKILAARPDCILIRPMISNSSPDLIAKLRQFGITVISLQPSTAPELFEYWRTLGQLSGTQGAAEQMITRFQENLAALRNKTASVPVDKRPRVYFEAIHARMKTFSPDSIAIFCLESAGGINVAADAEPRRKTNIAGYSKERILAKAESIDVLLAQSGRMNRITVKEIVSEPGFAAIKAVRDKRVYLIDEDTVSRPTPKLIEGIQQIYRLLYQN